MSPLVPGKLVDDPEILNLLNLPEGWTLRLDSSGTSRYMLINDANELVFETNGYNPRVLAKAAGSDLNFTIDDNHAELEKKLEEEELKSTPENLGGEAPAEPVSEPNTEGEDLVDAPNLDNLDTVVDDEGGDATENADAEEVDGDSNEDSSPVEDGHDDKNAEGDDTPAVDVDAIAKWRSKDKLQKLIDNEDATQEERDAAKVRLDHLNGK